MSSKTAKAPARFRVNQSSESGDCVTVEFDDEDHTLGNALRYMIIKNSDVKFCGYSLPHPNEMKCLMQIQMAAGSRFKALDALERGLRDLMQVAEHIKTEFVKEVEQFEG